MLFGLILRLIKAMVGLGLMLGVSPRAFAQFGEVIIGAALVGGGVFACSKQPDTNSTQNSSSPAIAQPEKPSATN